MRRFVVETGEKVSDFFANDLQNIYYMFHFKSLMKKRLKGKAYPIDRGFEKSAVLFWKKYGLSIDPMWHSFFSYCNKNKSVFYIPESLYYSKVEPFYNNKALAKAFDDKCYYSVFFPEAITPSQVVKKIGGVLYDQGYKMISKEDAVELVLGSSGGLFFKPSIGSGGGNRITYLEGIGLSKESVESVFLSLGDNFVVEHSVSQHPVLEKLNPSSLNTIRVITYLRPSGVVVLSSVLRMGGEGSKTDNFSTGGIACGIESSGICKGVAYDQNYNSYSEHPGGEVFSGLKVPSFDEACALAVKEHEKFGHFKIISWDIAIDQCSQPVLLEFNLTPQSIDFHQINNGPLFGDYTEEVLERVFLDKS